MEVARRTALLAVLLLSASTPVLVGAQPAPTIASFAINNGATLTTSRRVTLTNSCAGRPTHTMASERSGFSGAKWQRYSTAPSFVLSNGNGTKTVYLKVRGAGGESAPVRDTIGLHEVAPPTIRSFTINSGAFSTTDRRVTLDFTCTGRPTHYMASERSNFHGARWERYEDDPSFEVSNGVGTKTVYFKVRGAGGESAPARDTITLR